MSLIHLQALQDNPAFILAIWQMDESLEQLKLQIMASGREDLMPPATITNEKRKTEWLATRCALLQVNKVKREGIYYNENGKPFLLSGAGHISIAHAWPHVCILMHETRLVGVDIESMTDRILRIAPKFINEEERKWLSTPFNIYELYLIWAAKEAVFKLKGGGGIDFRLHLTVNATSIQNKGIAILTYSKNGLTEQLNIYYQFLDRLIVVYTIANDTHLT